MAVTQIQSHPQQYLGLSTDTKPTSDCEVNALFLELDTKDIYYNATGSISVILNQATETVDGFIGDPFPNCAAQIVDGSNLITNGVTYHIDYNGAEYDLVAQTTVIGDVTAVYLGSFDILLGSAGTYPFFFGGALTRWTFATLTGEAGHLTITTTNDTANQWEKFGGE